MNMLLMKRPKECQVNLDYQHFRFYSYYPLNPNHRVVSVDYPSDGEAGIHADGANYLDDEAVNDSFGVTYLEGKVDDKEDYPDCDEGEANHPLLRVGMIAHRFLPGSRRDEVVRMDFFV